MSKRSARKLTAAALASTMAIGMLSSISFAEEAKWSEEKTSDGWIRVTQEDGPTLGYSENSGVTILTVDGYAFKDLNQNGELDVYEDWREDAESRATDLANRLSGEEIAPLTTHGGWSSFGSTIGADEEYLEAGGRAGVTRSAATKGSGATASKWVNVLQEYAETNGGYGIPITISVDPLNIDGTIDQNALASTFDTELVHEIGVENAKDYRKVGITMLLGPQIDITTSPLWDRTGGTYSEDPALNRDLAAAFVDGLQSTYDEEGNDLGWGEDSVVAIVKHYAGAGASEGGRNDHHDTGKYTVFPGDSFAAHLVPFFDGAFNLEGATEAAGGVMPNYAIAWSDDGSLGEKVGGAYSAFKIGLLRENGYDGFLLTDWQITEDPDGPFGSRAFGVEDLTQGERFAKLFENDVDQVGGTTNVEAALEGWEIMVEDLGEEAALENMRNHARRFFVTQINTGLFENPYITAQGTRDMWTDASQEFGIKTQLASIVMIKNHENVIHEANGEKETVYVPYEFSEATEATSSAEAQPSGWNPILDLDVVSQYYNVVTDTVADPSGSDEDGNPVYTEEDIIRANDEELATVTLAIVPMTSPYTDGTADEEGYYLPASIQYEAYTADAARYPAIANGVEIITMSDGYYGTTTMEVEEDRSYQGASVDRNSNYKYLERLQNIKETLPEDAKIVVVMQMNANGAMVYSEVEPLVDAILVLPYGCGASASTYLQIVAGEVEPKALLMQGQPASMEAAETQLEDVPHDTECYVDADGNVYEFAFGLNWSGIIEDERTATYKVDPVLTPASIEFHYAE